MSIMVGVQRGAHMGVLIKNAEALERMEHIDTLVVDKTGTLTEGKRKVVAVDAELLGLAAGVERTSEHPLADAIVNEPRIGASKRPTSGTSTRPSAKALSGRSRGKPMRALQDAKRRRLRGYQPSTDNLRPRPSQQASMQQVC